MTKWDYRVFKLLEGRWVERRPEGRELQDYFQLPTVQESVFLGQLGEEGWELIQVVPEGLGLLFYFKRPRG